MAVTSTAGNCPRKASKNTYTLLPRFPSDFCPCCRPQASPSVLSLAHGSGATCGVGETPAVPSYPLRSLGLKVQFRPTESLSRKRLAVHVLLFMHQERIEKQAESNFPNLKAPHSLWSLSNRIFPLASHLKGPPSR